MIKVNLRTTAETAKVLFASERESVQDILSANGIAQPSEVLVRMDSSRFSLDNVNVPIRELMNNGEVCVDVTVSAEPQEEAAESLILPFPETGRIIRFGCAALVVSAFSPDELKQIKARFPEALQLKDDAGHSVFNIDICDDGPGHLDDDHAVFSTVRSGNGKATITVLIDPDADDKTATLRKTVGDGVERLLCLEAQIADSFRMPGKSSSVLLQ